MNEHAFELVMFAPTMLWGSTTYVGDPTVAHSAHSHPLLEDELLESTLDVLDSLDADEPDEVEVSLEKLELPLLVELDDEKLDPLVTEVLLVLLESRLEVLEDEGSCVQRASTIPFKAKTTVKLITPVNPLLFLSSIVISPPV